MFKIIAMIFSFLLSISQQSFLQKKDSLLPAHHHFLPCSPPFTSVLGQHLIPTEVDLMEVVKRGEKLRHLGCHHHTHQSFEYIPLGLLGFFQDPFLETALYVFLKKLCFLAIKGDFPCLPPVGDDIVHGDEQSSGQLCVLLHGLDVAWEGGSVCWTLGLIDAVELSVPAGW